jgi:glutamate-1-semialdehyde 2,1-aminomutase
VPSSEGVPESIARNTWVLPYNNVDALENLFQRQGVNVAAVIVEPVCGNMGVVKPTPEFLKALRGLSERYGAVLIFDEVMTGFRLAWGGAQELFKIKPDITCLGKIIGGGFPVGAFGGSKKMMEKVAPMGGVYQAGTLSGNPMAMAAGLATLKILKAKPPYEALEKSTRALCEFLRKIARQKKVEVQVNQMGSMFTVFFTDQKVDSYLTATQSDTTAFAAFFHALLENGVYMPPSQFEAAFVSTAHTPAVMKSAEKAFAAAFERVANR